MIEYLNFLDVQGNTDDWSVTSDHYIVPACRFRQEISSRISTFVKKYAMRKIYYLKTCDTCKRILKSLPNTEGFAFQDIKEQPLTVAQLEAIHALTGSYEVLFSKRAKLYKERNMKDEVLTEADYKRYILEHYTFLNRPVIMLDDQVFVGNSPKVVAQAIAALSWVNVHGRSSLRP